MTDPIADLVAHTWAQAMLACLRPPGQVKNPAHLLRDMEKTCWEACLHMISAATAIVCEAHEYTEGHAFNPDPSELAVMLDRLELGHFQYEPALKLVRDSLRAYTQGDAASSDACASTFAEMTPGQRVPVYHMFATLLRDHTLTLTRQQSYVLQLILAAAPHPQLPQAHIYAALHCGAAAASDVRNQNAVLSAMIQGGTDILPDVVWLLVRTLAAQLNTWAQAIHPGSSCGCRAGREAEEILSGWVTAAASGTPGIYESIVEQFGREEDVIAERETHLLAEASDWLAGQVREQAGSFQGV